MQLQKDAELIRCDLGEERILDHIVSTSISKALCKRCQYCLLERCKGYKYISLQIVSEPPVPMKRR